MDTDIFPWCSPEVKESCFSEDTIRQIVCDVKALNTLITARSGNSR